MPMKVSTTKQNRGARAYHPGMPVVSLSQGDFRGRTMGIRGRFRMMNRMGILSDSTRGRLSRTAEHKALSFSPPCKGGDRGGGGPGVDRSSVNLPRAVILSLLVFC